MKHQDNASNFGRDIIMDENDGSVGSQPKTNPSEKNVFLEELEVNGEIP